MFEESLVSAFPEDFAANNFIGFLRFHNCWTGKGLFAAWTCQVTFGIIFYRKLLNKTKQKQKKNNNNNHFKPVQW